MTLILNVRNQKKHIESDIELNFQNLVVLFMINGTKSSNFFSIFINLSIFVGEYRTRRPDIPHLNERYVTADFTQQHAKD